GYRKQLVGRVSDDVVRSFWFEEWAKWKPQFRAEAIAPVQNKVGALVTHPLLRNVLGDSRARLDLREVLDSGKVLLCNLSNGRVRVRQRRDACRVSLGPGRRDVRGATRRGSRARRLAIPAEVSRLYSAAGERNAESAVFHEDTPAAAPGRTRGDCATHQQTT